MNHRGQTKVIGQRWRRGAGGGYGVVVDISIIVAFVGAVVPVAISRALKRA